ncbi:hypothetical protein Talka_01527 [Tepidimonas alkaliphilus]|uniref:DUF484 family protein n=1 Tax=Tepidimonas alkaliphilus TaxID=2588942 RepID=A0A554W781_9BURK|nr:DUF484 family protein [Tepidimonas alkaliphilus]TSE19438.1 hypothetical protein Talka_01527 [Tepidimonas alkaliphilus]
MSTAEGLQPLTEDDIAQYLLHRPDFFERHADLLAAVQLTSPLTGRAISLLERQVEILRERLRQLELRTAEMIRHGQDNMALLQRLHQWTCALLATEDPSALPERLTAELARQFSVPQVALRLWDVQAAPGAPWAVPVDEETRAFVQSLPRPFVGVNPGVQPLQWLSDPAAAASVALVPLRPAAHEPAFGLLVLASDDPQRFEANAGTDLLQRLGELAAAALGRLRSPRTSSPEPATPNA